MNNEIKAKICPICSEENKCGMEENLQSCWCLSVVFSDALNETLKKDFPNQPCICKTCFEKMNEEKNG